MEYKIWTTEWWTALRSLEQRIAQRLRFPISTWQLDTRRGTESVIGREFTPSLAAGVISAAIRDEGGSEITDIVDVTATIDVWQRGSSATRQPCGQSTA